jgi:hypothetical protein
MARTDSPETHNELSVAPYTVWAFVPEKRTTLNNTVIQTLTEWVEPAHYEYISDYSNLPSAKRMLSMYPHYRIFDNNLGVWLK